MFSLKPLSRRGHKNLCLVSLRPQLLVSVNKYIMHKHSLSFQFWSFYELCSASLTQEYAQPYEACERGCSTAVTWLLVQCFGFGHGPFMATNPGILNWSRMTNCTSLGQHCNMHIYYFFTTGLFYTCASLQVQIHATCAVLQTFFVKAIVHQKRCF